MSAVDSPLLAFDPDALELDPADPDGAREACLATLRRLRADLESAFHAGARVEDLVKGHAEVMDHVLGAAWDRFLGPAAESLTLAAVGGYGRGELHPASDIDLLILVPDDAPVPAAELESLLAFLWDIGLEVGHSVRTVAECIEAAREDLTVITNLVEARYLAGNRTLMTAMLRGTNTDRMWASAEFFAAKVEEQHNRYHHYHDTAYNLEPNVKEGPGGLRDLHTIKWVLKRHYGTGHLSDLIHEGFLTKDECDALLAGRDFLWRVRFALHLLTGRHEDRLHVDHQRTLARQFGYRDQGHRLAVELFMRDYYRTITELSRLNEMLLALFEQAILWADRPERVVDINARFQARNGLLEATHQRVFKRYPFALLELFLVMQQHPELEGVSPATIRLVRDHTHLIDEGFRADIRARSLFMEILRQPRGLTHELRRMHRYGVLGAFLPAFGEIEGQMQHDLFHVYTVDVHTLFVLRNLRRFTVPKHREEMPFCHDLMETLPKPELVYLAALFHDIAKGRGGDHSQLGAEDARAFCEYLGLSAWDRDLVSWLVRHHLTLSTTAQRRDISDPDVINEFATLVGDRVHLNYLYLLTVADIRGTNPTLWNSWKDALFKELYHVTLRALRRGLENPVGYDELVLETRGEAWQRLADQGLPRAEVDAFWNTLGDDYFMRHSPDEIAWQARAVFAAPDPDRPLVLVRRRTHRGGTEVFVSARDREHLFARVTTTIDQLGLTIADARIITSSANRALDTLIVLEENGRPIEGEQRLEEIQAALEGTLEDPEAPPEPVSRRVRRTLKHFPVATETTFRDDPANDRTCLEVTASDRPGLLSRIALAMTRCGVQLLGAKVATFGERAEDIFLVTDGDWQPLDEDLKARLSDAIHEHLD